MEYQVYLDVLFFWNLILDCLILHQTGLILKRNREKGKRQTLQIIVAGIVGAIGSCLVTICYFFPLFLKLVLTIPGLSCLMVWIGFPRAKGSAGRRLFVRQYLTFLGNSLLLGGLVVFLQYRFSLGTFWAVALAGSLTEGGIRLYRGFKTRQNHLYDVCLYYGGRPINIKGFYDTGNHLICPWNQKAVHIIDEACLGEEIPVGERQEEEKEPGSQKKEELAEGFFYIPFSSVGKEGGIIKAAQAESLKVFRDEGELLIEKPIVALGASSLFHGRPYQMILHSSISDIKSS